MNPFDDWEYLSYYLGIVEVKGSKGHIGNKREDEFSFGVSDERGGELDNHRGFIHF